MDQNTSLAVFVGSAAITVFGLPKLVRLATKRFREEPVAFEPQAPEFFDIKLYDGPLDQHIKRVSKDECEVPPHFYIAPYTPALDEEGNPPRENVIGWMRGVVYLRPNFAYYQQVTDEDYFYVRDLDEPEVDLIQRTGKLPEFQKQDGDEE